MEFGGLVDVTHFVFIVGNDLDEVSHDVGKESNAAKHDQNGSNSLQIGNRKVISISDSGKSGQRIVTTNDELRCPVFIGFSSELVVSYKIIDWL